MFDLFKALSEDGQFQYELEGSMRAAPVREERSCGCSRQGDLAEKAPRFEGLSLLSVAPADVWETRERRRCAAHETNSKRLVLQGGSLDERSRHCSTTGDLVRWRRERRSGTFTANSKTI